MIFEQPEGLGVALYIQREELLESGIVDLDREDVCRLARMELEREGYENEGLSTVEAFENQEGWLVFAAASKPKQTFYHFPTSNDYLDAVNTNTLAFTQTWRLQDGSLIGKVCGSTEALTRAAMTLSEFGIELDGSVLLFKHLDEHSSMQ